MPVVGHLCVLTLVCTALILEGGGARAAYPGVNGRIAFRDFGADGGAGLFTMEPDGTDLRRITFGFDDHPNFAPDGSMILFDRASSGADLWMTAADGSGTPTQITTDRAKTKESFASFSPDGSMIAYQAEAKGQVDVWLLDVVDGRATNRRPITMSRANDGRPAWSPAGDQIAFVSNRDGDDDVYTIRVDGSDPADVIRRTSTSVQEYYPDWSPDGARLLYGRTDASGDHIWALDLVAGTEQKLTVVGSLNGGANWSPDGRQIVFNSYRADGAHNQLYVMPAAGESVLVPAEQLTNRSSGAWWADWQRVHPTPSGGGCDPLPICGT